MKAGKFLDLDDGGFQEDRRSADDAVLEVLYLNATFGCHRWSSAYERFMNAFVVGRRRELGDDFTKGG